MPASATFSPPPLKTEIVIPVHNRRATTLRCLETLQRLGAMDWAGVIVTDDGSGDGTGDAIRNRFPGVTILTGDGNLWWTGAIVRGMEHALARGAELIFWLNDDCLPAAGTLERLAQHAAARQGVAVGQAFTPAGLRYGAYLRTAGGLRAIHAGPGEVLACDTFCGNCVCFPRALVERVGLPDTRSFPQTFGDSDYGLRLRRLGVPMEVLGDAVCGNEDNHYIVSKSWLLSREPIGRLAASFLSPKSNLYPSAYLRYQWRHWGAWGLVLFLVPYLKFCCFAVVRLLTPRRWLLAWVGGRSEAWRRESSEGK